MSIWALLQLRLYSPETPTLLERCIADLLAIDAFKPASVTHTTPGTYYPSQGSSTSQPAQVVFDVKNGSQVFDVREETMKGRECVMIFNEENNVSSSASDLLTVLADPR